MERSVRSRRSRTLPRRITSTPYPLRSCRWEVSEETIPRRRPTLALLEKKDWEDATCSVCMEFPHNAVLLLCSSHNKGCRPYMCGTSYRHSNCLDQFKKAYTKIHDEDLLTGDEKSEVIELAACPLCRGQVKGWTVVETAREYLNNKKRSCMQDNCSFTGTYRELKKHVRSDHPCAKPRQVDPTLQQKWRRLEHEREREDVISTIRSSMPRSVVFGDYVIEMSTNSDLEVDSDEEEGEGIMVGDGTDVGSSHGGGISRNILYFFLQEGARMMRLHRDSRWDENGRNNDGEVPSLGSTEVDPSVATAYSSGGDDDDYGLVPPASQDDGSAGMNERRRRRRRRSRGRSSAVDHPS